MRKISNKKKKFIRKNFKRLSIDELVDKTRLKPHIVRSVVDECGIEELKKGRDPLLKEVGHKNHVARRYAQAIGILAIFVFVLTFLVYTPALNNDFVNWDDNIYVYENINIRSLNLRSLSWAFTSFRAGNWHPITWLSHAMDYAFWELNPMGHHLTNVILHALNTLLVFLLVVQLMLKAKETNGKSFPPTIQHPLLIHTIIAAVMTALLFGLHPLHVESVAWVSERKDLLCAFFFLLGIVSYLSYASSDVKRYRLIWFASCLLLFICALMSKPMAVTLPIILILLDIYPLKRINSFFDKTDRKFSVVLEKIPFFTLSMVSGIITIKAQKAGEAIVSFEGDHQYAFLLNATRSLVFYLEKMFIPIKLVPFYPFPIHINWLDWQFLLSAFLILVITGGALWMAKRGRVLFPVIWLYYVVTLLPVIGIIHVGIQGAADRYTYLPSLGIFFFISVGVASVFKRFGRTSYKGLFRGILLTLICTVLIIMSQLTIKQIRIWRNSEIMWSYVITVFPNRVPIAHDNLGNAYIKQGRLDEALSEFKKALDLKPRYAKAHNNLGVAYQKQGKLDEALLEFKKALDLKPRYAKAHYNLGIIYQKQGKLDEALSEFKKALDLKPRYAKASYNLGNIYYYKKNYQLATVYFGKAAELGYRVNPKLLGLR